MQAPSSSVQQAEEPLMAYKQRLLDCLLLAAEGDVDEGGSRSYSGLLVSALELHLHKQQAYIEYLHRQKTSAPLAAAAATGEDRRQVLVDCFQGADLRYSPATRPPSWAKQEEELQVGPSL